MNCAELSTQLGFRCKPVREGLMYVESPLSLSFDGMLIGAFVQELGRGLVRITDNADILFTAMTHGIQPHAGRAKTFSLMAKENGFELSDGGEIYATCPSDQAGFHLARFMEVASRIGFACESALAVTPPRFETKVGKVLSRRFGKRMRRSFSVAGASGHQLTFPFVLDQGTDHQMAILTIPSGTKGKPNWGSIYGAVGKMGDLKNSGDPTIRTIILQDGDEQSIQQATVALAEVASIVIYDGNDGRFEEQIKSVAA